MQEDKSAGYFSERTKRIPKTSICLLTRMTSQRHPCT